MAWNTGSARRRCYPGRSKATYASTRGVRFHLVGMLTGNLYVEPGAECQIDGIVLGDVENAGHTSSAAPSSAHWSTLPTATPMSTPTHPSPASIPRPSEHPLAETGEARLAVIAERDQLAIEREAAGQAGELGVVWRHLPPLTTQTRSRPTLDEAAEPVPLELVRVVTAGSGPLWASIGSGSGANVAAYDVPARHTAQGAVK